MKPRVRSLRSVMISSNGGDGLNEGVANSGASYV